MRGARDDSSLRPRGDLRVVFSRLNGDDGAGRKWSNVVRVRRDDRKGIRLGGMSEATRAINPDVIRVGAVHAKAFLLATGFFGFGERTARFAGTRGGG